MTGLKVLDRSARALVTDAYLAGDAIVDFGKYEREPARAVRLEPLEAVLAHAMREFDADPVASDKWLAPRLHAALRLTRRETADRNLWSYLALVPFERYVRWRFANVPAERFIGAENNHALGRLWWGAELLRNGPAYDDVVTAFKIQDIPNTGFRFDAFHHRPLAVAVVRVLGAWRGGEPATGREANKLLKAINMELVTVALDADIPAPNGAMDSSWLTTVADPDALIGDALPVGPADSIVPAELLDSAVELVKKVAEDIKLAG